MHEPSISIMVKSVSFACVPIRTILAKLVTHTHDLIYKMGSYICKYRCLEIRF